MTARVRTKGKVQDVSEQKRRQPFQCYSRTNAVSRNAASRSANNAQKRKSKNTQVGEEKTIKVLEGTAQCHCHAVCYAVASALLLSLCCRHAVATLLPCRRCAVAILRFAMRFAMLSPARGASRHLRRDSERGVAGGHPPRERPKASPPPLRCGVEARGDLPSSSRGLSP